MKKLCKRALLPIMLCALLALGASTGALADEYGAVTLPIGEDGCWDFWLQQGGFTGVWAPAGATEAALPRFKNDGTVEGATKLIVQDGFLRVVAETGEFQVPDTNSPLLPGPLLAPDGLAEGTYEIYAQSLNGSTYLAQFTVTREPVLTAARIIENKTLELEFANWNGNPGFFSWATLDEFGFESTLDAVFLSQEGGTLRFTLSEPAGGPLVIRYGGGALYSSAYWVELAGTISLEGWSDGGTKYLGAGESLILRGSAAPGRDGDRLRRRRVGRGPGRGPTAALRWSWRAYRTASGSWRSAAPPAQLSTSHVPSVWTPWPR